MKGIFCVLSKIWHAAYLGFLLSAGVASAQVTISNPIQAKSFHDIIAAIARFATTIITPISVVVILYAGFLYMFSAGNPEKVKKARQALTWALVGLAIVLIGQGFIYIIEDVLKGGASGSPTIFPCPDPGAEVC